MPTRYTSKSYFRSAFYRDLHKRKRIYSEPELGHLFADTAYGDIYKALYLLGCRVGVLLQLHESHVGYEIIKLPRGKRGQLLDIPISPQFRAFLRRHNSKSERGFLFWRDYAPALCPDYGGVKLSPHRQPPEMRIMTMPGHGFGYLDDSPIAGRQWRGTSDYFALQLAHYWRAAQIGLVGVDLIPANRREAGIFGKRRECLKWVIGELSRRGVEVVTITKGSTLGVPYRPLAKIQTTALAGHYFSEVKDIILGRHETSRVLLNRIDC